MLKKLTIFVAGMFTGVVAYNISSRPKSGAEPIIENDEMAVYQTSERDSYDESLALIKYKR